MSVFDLPRHSIYAMLATGEAREHVLWWQARGLSYTRTGYGRQIPTTWQLRINGRWRRVYCCIFSNSGTCYIGKPGNWQAIVDD